MSGLKKATLWELSADEKPTPKDGTNVDVQFNPTSLRLQLQSSASTGKTAARQAAQIPSQTPRTLSFDLVFDSADEGETDAAADVRDKMANVERFIRQTSPDPPPKIRFHWGTFVFDGVMTSLSEELDLFSADGVPLRAKCSVSITEQNPDFEAKQSGPGAKDASGATEPGKPAAGTPGSSGTSSTNRTALALGGETAADFAVRVGLDASAWRGLSAGLDASLSLEAGLSIDFSAGLSVSAGLGVSAGFEAEASLSLEASFGLDASASLAAGAAASFGATGSVASGMALSAAGGLSAATNAVQIIKTESAAASARAAFGAPAAPAKAALGTPASASAASSSAAVTLGAGSLPSSVAVATQSAAASPGSPPPRPARPDQPRTPLASAAGGAGPGLAARAVASAAPRPPSVDPRAASYGFGVPLRPRVTGAADERSAAAGGFVVVAPKPRTAAAPMTRDRGEPSWARLPSASTTRAAADTAQASRRPVKPCGCACPCRHGGGGP